MQLPLLVMMVRDQINSSARHCNRQHRTATLTEEKQRSPTIVTASHLESRSGPQSREKGFQVLHNAKSDQEEIEDLNSSACSKETTHIPKPYQYIRKLNLAVI